MVRALERLEECNVAEIAAIRFAVFYRGNSDFCVDDFRQQDGPRAGRVAGDAVAAGRGVGPRKRASGPGADGFLVRIISWRPGNCDIWVGDFEIAEVFDFRA